MMPLDGMVIEKNTIQATLIVPLYGRKMCSEKFPKHYQDPFARDLCDKLAYDFSDLEKRRIFFYMSLALLKLLCVSWILCGKLKRT